MIIRGKGKYPYKIEIPGDKSISHRSIIFSSISKGKTRIKNILLSEDVIRTIECFKAMGVEIKVFNDENEVEIIGVGLDGLKKPEGELYCGNSGTTMRLMAGLLVGQKFDSTLTGDKSLTSRPMGRIIKPLKKMGASIEASEDNTAPLKIIGNKDIKSIDYKMPVDSAQLKSCIILASLYAERDSHIMEKNPSRDHTERMLYYFRENNWKVKELFIPGDISSAAYFIAGGLINKGSKIKLKKIGVNKTRTGIIDVFKDMGGNIEIENKMKINNEDMADIIVRKSSLKGINIGRDIMGRMIDEIPILSVVASFANGKTLITGAEELRYKETDRISATYNELKKFGVNIEELEDGLKIKESLDLKSAIVKSYGDHRMAMALTIMAYNIDGKSEILNSNAVKISFPNFYKTFQ